MDAPKTEQPTNMDEVIREGLACISSFVDAEVAAPDSCEARVETSGEKVTVTGVFRRKWRR